MKTEQTIFWTTKLTACGASSKITAECIGKMEKGEEKYGTWEAEDDPRDLLKETVEELQDAINYCVMYLQKKEGKMSPWDVLVVENSVASLIEIVENLDTNG